MILKKNASLKLILLMMCGMSIISLLPQQAEARRGHTSVHRSSNRNTNVNVNKNTRKNTNVNVNRNTNVNVNVDHRRGGYHHPVATAVAVGATVAVTAAVVGSVVNTIPATGCTTVIKNGISYSQCGNVWYEPRYSGNSVTYVVVNPM